MENGIKENKRNIIDELAGMARDRWNGTREEQDEKEQILLDRLKAFSSERQPICDREESVAKTEDQKAAQRTAYSLLRMAVEERMLAKAMLEAPEDHVNEDEYDDESQVVDAAESIMEHVESCMDVAQVLLMDLAG